MSEALPNSPPRPHDEPSRPSRKVAWTYAVVALVFAGAGAAAWVVRPWEKASASAPGPAPGGPAESIVVDGVELAPRPIELTVPVVGTLVANESVPIASELSRRVVQVLATDGARVKKGDLLFKLDDADLHAQAKELQVRKKLLEVNKARQKRLFDDGLSSQADYEKASADLELVDAELGSLAVTISRTSIRAPFDGRLGLRNVSAGAMVSPTTPLVTLNDDARIKIDFSLPERYATFVSVGRKFTFKVAGSDGARDAELAAVEPSVDATSRSLKVRGVTDNANGDLLAGSFVTIDFPLESHAGGLMVPALAVIPSLGGHGVWVARDGKSILVDVELGVRTDAEVEVRSEGEGGIHVGDVVLTTNLLRLRPGGPVTLGTVTK